MEIIIGFVNRRNKEGISLYEVNIANLSLAFLELFRFFHLLIHFKIENNDSLRREIERKSKFKLSNYELRSQNKLLNLKLLTLNYFKTLSLKLLINGTNLLSSSFLLSY
jgi:hypothetical protein